MENLATVNEENRIKQQLTAEAYETVFGQEKKRTEAQRLVLEDLRKGIDDELNSSFKFSDGGRDGIALIAAGIKRDGAKGVLRLINERLLMAVELRQKPKPPAKVKR